MLVVLVVVVIVAVAVVAALLRTIRRGARDRAALAAALAGRRREDEQLDALERAKSEFLATASHELRSPLTSVKGFVELLENGTRDGRFTDREREFLDIIRRSTDRLVQLTDELLDVAQIDADHLELARRPIDVGEAIREVAEMMGPQLLAKEQQLGIYIAPTLPLALADSGRVRQVIANLLTNAHLYTPVGGRIHIGAEADRAWVRIVVADSGIGMSQREAERIFERFYRAPGATAVAAGTGLGLSIVRSLVDLHGGEIEVASRPDAGTTFQVRLPATRPKTGNARDALSGRRVLVVDDDPAAGALVGSMLTDVDAQAHVVADAHAVAALTAEHYDAVTLTVAAGEAAGHALARRIRAHPELQASPIVFLDPAGDDPRLAGEWTARIPIDAAELRAVLAAALRAGRSRVLVVAREELQPRLEPTLDELGIEYQWECSGVVAARVCGERRFEVALLDVGLRNPEATLEALALRGRRLQHAVILFSEAHTPRTATAPGMEVVPMQQAPDALLAALRGERHQPLGKGVR